jgi:hypothetical protein
MNCVLVQNHSRRREGGREKLIIIFFVSLFIKTVRFKRPDAGDAVDQCGYLLSKQSFSTTLQEIRLMFQRYSVLALSNLTAYLT